MDGKEEKSKKQKKTPKETKTKFYKDVLEGIKTAEQFLQVQFGAAAVPPER